MRLRLLNLWYRLRASYWLLPALAAAGAVALSLGTVAMDQSLVERAQPRLAWLYAGGPEGARALLATVAGSMITVASLTFSITMVALSLASSQFGPRLLINFLRDTGNQVVLGTFTATFLYCLLVLRTVRNGPENPFVPHISVTVALALAVASVGVLIYFIHHAAVGIRVERVIAAVNRDLVATIDRLFPGPLSQEAPAGRELEVPAEFESGGTSIAARGSGYVQAVDLDGLLRIAHERDALLWVRRRPGHFVIQGSSIALVWPPDRGDERLAADVNEAFILGAERAAEYDVEFAVTQLVEVALRALSPGINDPFTAIACVHHLGAALARLAGRRAPSRYRYDDDGRLRVIADATDFEGVVNTAFDQIRQAARTNAAVTIALLETLAVIAPSVETPEDCAALLRQAAMIRTGSEDVPEAADRAAVEERHRSAVAALERRGRRDSATVVREIDLRR